MASSALLGVSPLPSPATCTRLLSFILCMCPNHQSYAFWILSVTSRTLTSILIFSFWNLSFHVTLLMVWRHLILNTCRHWTCHLFIAYASTLYNGVARATGPHSGAFSFSGIHLSDRTPEMFFYILPALLRLDCISCLSSSVTQLSRHLKIVSLIWSQSITLSLEAVLLVL